ncbi:hypothetical protein LZ32DRAFT_692391 [Colletotrichum eremochloae]|nr:hypothetical protein LZ32DRAFT_692391 [Colletotrichum eremochloae]
MIDLQPNNRVPSVDAIIKFTSWVDDKYATKSLTQENKTTLSLIEDCVEDGSYVEELASQFLRPSAEFDKTTEVLVSALFAWERILFEKERWDNIKPSEHEYADFFEDGEIFDLHARSYLVMMMIVANQMSATPFANATNLSVNTKRFRQTILRLEMGKPLKAKKGVKLENSDRWESEGDTDDSSDGGATLSDSETLDLSDSSSPEPASSQQGKKRIFEIRRTTTQHQKADKPDKKPIDKRKRDTDDEVKTNKKRKTINRNEPILRTDAGDRGELPKKPEDNEHKRAADIKPNKRKMEIETDGEDRTPKKRKNNEHKRATDIKPNKRKMEIETEDENRTPKKRKGNEHKRAKDIKENKRKMKIETDDEDMAPKKRKSNEHKRAADDSLKKPKGKIIKRNKRKMEIDTDDEEEMLKVKKLRIQEVTPQPKRKV